MSDRVNKIYRIFKAKNEGKISLQVYALKTYILTINKIKRVFISEYSLLVYLEGRI